MFLLMNLAFLLTEHLSGPVICEQTGYLFSDLYRHCAVVYASIFLRPDWLMLGLVVKNGGCISILQDTVMCVLHVLICAYLCVHVCI